MAVITRPDDIKSIIADLKKRIATLEKSRLPAIRRLQNAQFGNFQTMTPSTSFADAPSLASQYVTLKPDGTYSAAGVVTSFVLTRPTRSLLIAQASCKVTAGSGFAYGQAVIRAPGSGPAGFVGNTPGSVVDSASNSYQPMFMETGNAFYMLDGVTHPGDMYGIGTYQCMLQFSADAGVTQLSIGRLNVDVFSFGD